MLALDTTMGACSVALLQTGREERLWQAFEPMARGHAEALFPMIADVMKQAGAGFATIDRLAVTTGPGTFTGIRLGVAAARGLALAMARPVVTATALEVIAARLVREAAGETITAGLVIAVDARRGEIYTQTFSADGVATGPVVIASPEASAARLGRGVQGATLAGSAAPLLSRALDGRGVATRLVMDERPPHAAVLARIGLSRAPDAGPISPLYLRAPDAKPQTGFAVSQMPVDQP